MNDPCTDTLAGYDAVATRCERMLEAARRGEWPKVADIESDARRLIGELRERSTRTRLDPTARRHKFRILRDILLIDAQIRHLADPRQQRIDRMLLGARDHDDSSPDAGRDRPY